MVIIMIIIIIHFFRLDNYRTKYQDANFNGNVEIDLQIIALVNRY